MEGVELAAPLHAQAESNVAAYRGRRRCSAIHLVCADAASRAIADDVSVVYLYNPFVGAVGEASLRQIEASQQRCPRHIRLISLHQEDALLRRVFPRAQAARPRVRRHGLKVYDLR